MTQQQLVPSCDGKGQPWAMVQRQENRLTSAQPRCRSQPRATSLRGYRGHPGCGMLQLPSPALPMGSLPRTLLPASLPAVPLLSGSRSTPLNQTP